MDPYISSAFAAAAVGFGLHLSLLKPGWTLRLPGSGTRARVARLEAAVEALALQQRQLARASLVLAALIRHGTGGEVPTEPQDETETP